MIRDARAVRVGALDTGIDTHHPDLRFRSYAHDPESVEDIVDEVMYQRALNTRKVKAMRNATRSRAYGYGVPDLPAALAGPALFLDLGVDVALAPGARRQASQEIAQCLPRAIGRRLEDNSDLRRALGNRLIQLESTRANDMAPHHDCP